jgi:hypothetical protein
MRSSVSFLVAGLVATALANGVGAVQDPTKPDKPVPLSQALASDPRLVSLAPAVRDKVLKEADDVKEYCATNNSLSDFFECDCFARKVFDRRFKVGSDVGMTGRGSAPVTGEFKVPFTVILMDRELDSGPCVAPEKIEAWARRLLVDPKMTEARKTCIARDVVARFKKKPYPGNVQALMRESIEACSAR